MFVADSDFNRLPYNIVGLDDISNVSNDFADFVEYNEEKHLRELLGNMFYDALSAAFPDLPAIYDATKAYEIGDKVVYVSKNLADIYTNTKGCTNVVPSTAANWTKDPVKYRWVRLVYGDMYTYYGRPQKWYGMKRLVVPLIYALWTKYTYDNQTSQGVVVGKNENANTVSPSVRIARAMNEYAELCAGDFPNVVDWHYMVWPELENSLFGYLYLNSEVWNDLVTESMPGFTDFKAYLAYSFSYPGKTNVFGI